MKIDVFYLRVICTCDQCDSPFCALQLTALIKPYWCVPLYCFACLYSLIVVQSSWTTVPCPTTKLSLLISKSFVGIKQSMISVTLKTPLKTRFGSCVYILSLPHRPDDYIGFTSSCPPTFYNKITPMPLGNLFLLAANTTCKTYKMPFCFRIELVQGYYYICDH